MGSEKEWGGRRGGFYQESSLDERNRKERKKGRCLRSNVRGVGSRTRKRPLKFPSNLKQRRGKIRVGGGTAGQGGGKDGKEAGVLLFGATRMNDRAGVRKKIPKTPVKEGGKGNSLMGQF